MNVVRHSGIVKGLPDGELESQQTSVIVSGDSPMAPHLELDYRIDSARMSHMPDQLSTSTSNRALSSTPDLI